VDVWCVYIVHKNFPVLLLFGLAIKHAFAMTWRQVCPTLVRDLECALTAQDTDLFLGLDVLAPGRVLAHVPWVGQGTVGVGLVTSYTRGRWDGRLSRRGFVNVHGQQQRNGHTTTMDTPVATKTLTMSWV